MSGNGNGNGSGSEENGKTEFSLPELARLSGIDSRTLHNWMQRGILTPSRQRANGSGTKNIFDAGDALFLVILADLRRGGAEIKLLEDAASDLREFAAHSTGGELLWITDQVQLVSDPGLLADNADRYGPALIYATSRAHRALSEFDADSSTTSECHDIPSVRAAV
jgi:DNA-binding transcriptional MerR regulator